MGYDSKSTIQALADMVFHRNQTQINFFTPDRDNSKINTESQTKSPICETLSCQFAVETLHQRDAKHLHLCRHKMIIASPPQ